MGSWATPVLRSFSAKEQVTSDTRQVLACSVTKQSKTLKPDLEQTKQPVPLCGSNICRRVAALQASEYASTQSQEGRRIRLSRSRNHVASRHADSTRSAVVERHGDAVTPRRDHQRRVWVQRSQEDEAAILYADHCQASTCQHRTGAGFNIAEAKQRRSSVHGRSGSS